VRVYADQTTGELVEHLPADMVGLEVYDYRQAKAAHMRASVERRKAQQAYETAIREMAAAERGYRSELAKAMLRAKDEHGATVAESMAKGDEKVLEARERYVIADGMRYAALEVIRNCDGDRQGIAQLVRWSQAVSTGPWGEG
jgi:hypothetical protein